MRKWEENNYVFKKEELFDKLNIKGKFIIRVELFENEEVKITTK